MPGFVPVATTADLKPGACQSIEVQGYGVALFNVDGQIYALDNTCPHAGGPLGEGRLQGDIVTCPWHGWRFNVRNGERPENPEIKAGCLRVQVEGSEIQVWLPPDWEPPPA